MKPLFPNQVIKLKSPCHWAINVKYPFPQVHRMTIFNKTIWVFKYLKVFSFCSNLFGKYGRGINTKKKQVFHWVDSMPSLRFLPLLVLGKHRKIAKRCPVYISLVVKVSSCSYRNTVKKFVRIWNVRVWVWVLSQFQFVAFITIKVL